MQVRLDVGPQGPARRQIRLPNPNARGFEGELHALAGLRERGFRRAASLSLARLADLTLDRRNQPRQPTLNEEVGRTRLERFDRSLLADRARRHDERDVEGALLQQPQCIEPGERWH